MINPLWNATNEIGLQHLLQEAWWADTSKGLNHGLIDSTYVLQCRQYIIAPWQKLKNGWSPLFLWTSSLPMWFSNITEYMKPLILLTLKYMFNIMALNNDLDFTFWIFYFISVCESLNKESEIILTSCTVLNPSWLCHKIFRVQYKANFFKAFFFVLKGKSMVLGHLKANFIHRMTHTLLKAVWF